MRFAWLPLLAAGCSGDASPTWAFDPLWLEPTEDGGVYGFQTWNVYAEAWTKSFDEGEFLCAIVVEVEGAPSAGEACPDCELAWDTTATVLETDCADSLAADPGFTSLTRVGIGPVGPDLGADDPYPARSHGGYADYGTGEWVPHGWAYPEALDTRGQAAETDWDGEQAFTFWPAFYWDLAGG
jgi:hypothetical protein